MKGPLAIEKSNFLIEPIDTPFSSSSLRTAAAAAAAAVPGLCMSEKRRLMTRLRFPPASAALNLSIWIQMWSEGLMTRMEK